MTFQLDTSGSIGAADQPGGYVAWVHLTPFCHGAVEAALRELWFNLRQKRHYQAATSIRFRHLAPATLAQIMADCEREVKHPHQGSHKEAGAAFWIGRNTQCAGNEYHKSGFPPRTLHLADDGMIHIKEPS